MENIKNKSMYERILAAAETIRNAEMNRVESKMDFEFIREMMMKEYLITGSKVELSDDEWNALMLIIRSNNDFFLRVIDRLTSFKEKQAKLNYSVGKDGNARAAFETSPYIDNMGYYSDYHSLGIASLYKSRMAQEVYLPKEYQPFQVDWGADINIKNPPKSLSLSEFLLPIKPMTCWQWSPSQYDFEAVVKAMKEVNEKAKLFNSVSLPEFGKKLIAQTRDKLNILQEEITGISAFPDGKQQRKERRKQNRNK